MLLGGRGGIEAGTDTGGGNLYNLALGRARTVEGKAEESRGTDTWRLEAEERAEGLSPTHPRAPRSVLKACQKPLFATRVCRGSRAG